MLRNADLAMYTAKSGGKNCARVFAHEMHLAAIERLDLEAHLRGAAERGELIVHYQPIYELQSGRIAACEALVRWQHPERGPLGPLLVHPVRRGGRPHRRDRPARAGDRVRGGDAAGRRRSATAYAPAVTVNVAPRQLLDPELPDRVECAARALRARAAPR